MSNQPKDMEVLETLDGFALLNGGEFGIDEFHFERPDAVDRLRTYHELTEQQGLEEGFEIVPVQIVIYKKES